MLQTTQKEVLILMTSKKLVVLSFAFFYDEYEENLQKLLIGILKAPKGSVVLAPELCLTNFSFDDMDKSAKFGEESLKKIKEASKDKIVSFSLTTKKDDNFFNTVLIIHDGEIKYRQDKYKLFKFGDEDKYFRAGDEDKIQIVEIDGIKFATLICFEIRFKQLWKRIEGADIVLVPALWGKLRKKQFEIITNSLAVINQAFVMASDSKNSDMAASSAIITPFGESLLDDSKDYLEFDADLSEIKKMRRYMDVGIK